MKSLNSLSREFLTAYYNNQDSSVREVLGGFLFREPPKSLNGTNSLTEIPKKKIPKLT